MARRLPSAASWAGAPLSAWARMASDHMVSHQSQKSDMPTPPRVVMMMGRKRRLACAHPSACFPVFSPWRVWRGAETSFAARGA